MVVEKPVQRRGVPDLGDLHERARIGIARGYAPGTKMSFNGLPSVEDRANLIAYLDTTSG